MSETIKLSDFPLQSSLADDDTIILNGKRITAANLLAAVRDSIKVGGRNYLKSAPAAQSNSVLQDGKISFRQDIDSFFKVFAATDMRHLIGQQLTFSLECSGLKDGSIWDFGVGSQHHNPIKLHNGKCYVSFIGSNLTCPNKGGEILIDDTIRDLKGMSPSDIRLWNFKLERGNIPTDWSPAPEDLLSASGGNTQIFSWLQSRERRCAA